ncbi:MAG: hypothetical protein NUW37_11490 [Planctomycetes bacterium]|nr:hypothetical protein [Planctomycetota bacterium]
MKPKDYISKISKDLGALGRSGTDYQIARILGVTQATVTRWKDETHVPQPKHEENLKLVHTVLADAAEGDKEAIAIAENLCAPGSMNFIALGEAGLYVASSMKK